MRSNNDLATSTEYGLSIIIPTYNAQKYIKECLDSVLEQVSDNSVEVICVDDGSEDETVHLLKIFEESHRCVKCYKKKHKGAWDARNLGVSAASKKYVAFLDADDRYEKGAIDKIRAACIGSEEPIIGFAYWSILDDRNIRREKIVSFSDDIAIPQDGRSMGISEWQNDYGYTNFIYGREFLNENGVSFPAYMRYEDPVFLLKALNCAGHFRLFSDSIYICRVGYKDSSELDRTIVDVLRGIRDNLAAAYEYGFLNLRRILLKRIDEEFYESIYRGLSDETMRVLLEISEINDKFDERVELTILSDIYKGAGGVRISERNYGREQEVIRDYRIFNNVTECMKRQGGFGRFLWEQGIGTVCVYGAGLYGRLLVQDFLLHGIEIPSVIDRNSAGDIEGIATEHPDEEPPACDLMIIALRDSSSVIHEYRKRGVKDIIGLDDLADKMMAGEIIFQEVLR